VRFRTKVFLSAFAVAALSLLVSTLLVSWSFRQQMLQQIERTLVAEGELTARLLEEQPADASLARYDEEADRVGRIVRSRVTFVARDGRVLGDSSVSGAALSGLDNHGNRPEVVAALRNGFGTSRRWSSTVDAQLMYVALPVEHGRVAVVRLALPLTDVEAQGDSVVPATIFALLIALVGAGGLAWISSRVLSRRLDELAAVALRYAAGDMSQRARDRGSDELGSVARVLDDSVQSLGRRVRELNDERARAQALLAGMVEGVVVVDAQGAARIVNEAAGRMLRLEDPVIGRPYAEFIRHPDIADQVRRALAGELTAGLELSLSREPGRVFVTRSAPVHAAGSRGAVLVLHDITDLRRADRVRRDFVANVSHELRTPLTAIRGYVEALLDGPSDPLETRRFLEIIERHAARMERLVKDLLRLARLDAGQETLERTAVDTHALFEGMLSELKPTLDGRRQRVQMEVQFEAGTIHGDAVKLHDMLRNLVENASNYSPEGSTITLQAERLGADVLLRVLDEGPGIPEADLQRVFERFYRVDKARSRETGGTGLGLSIVRHLADLHAGEVFAENRPGGGAAFAVKLSGAAVPMPAPV
jgi:two-component system phosphate regulon sensor histidine kinase PhoR